MSSITLATPQLVGKPPGDFPQIEQPVKLLLGPVVFDDGVEAVEEDVKKLGAFVYRVGAGSEQIWNEKEKLWQAAPADLAALADLEPLPFMMKPEEDPPWQSLLVAIGATDKDGNDRFTKVSDGSARYHVRAYAKVAHEGVELEALSPPSPDIGFVSMAEKMRFAIELEPKKPEECERVRLQLKNASLLPAGYLEIRAAATQEVELVNFAPDGARLASVLLAADGSIVLRPAATRKIVLEGELQAQKIKFIRYTSSGTGLTELD
jgi:hypothetical protein